MDLLNLLVLALVGYALGSLSPGVWLGWALLGRDIRAGGSGHSGGTNAARQGGWRFGLLVAVLDVAKGALAAWLAARWGLSPWTPSVVTAAAVAGHCWPVFAGFRGGMGLSVLGGALLVLSPTAFAVGLGLAAAGTLLLRHSARGNLAAGVLIGPAVWLVTGSATVALAAGAAGLVIALRSRSDWRRVYRELWLDRDPAAARNAHSD
ncbi:MAG: glycerol-3-phosphate acyltransferase [Anaerolineales bacterium]|nr:glycerol-3-phosphate acyltransferase [Anaerolineales bacterium]